jgi:hypothetical protein
MNVARAVVMVTHLARKVRQSPERVRALHVAQREPPAIDVAHDVLTMGRVKFSAGDLTVPRPDSPWTYVANFRPCSPPPASTTYCKVTVPHGSRTVTWPCSRWISPRGRGDEWSHRREAMDPPPATIRRAVSGQGVQALFDPGPQSG